jgi:hypothetical protein
MKKLLTAMIVSLVAGAVLADVVSQNIVGYQVEDSSGEGRTLSIKFREIGAGNNEFDITSVIDANTISEYSDMLQAYDANSGIFLNYIWDGSEWVDGDTFVGVEINVVPGNSFIILAEGAWTTLGEVASTTTYDHAIPLSEAVMVGNAFPAPQTLGNFNWSGVAEYSDMVQVYEPQEGVFLNMIWDGTQWLDGDSFDPVAFATPVEAFLFYSDTVDTLTQRLTEPYFLD